MPRRTTLERDAFDLVVASVREHTHSLLGLTIGYSEEEWAEPSRLPGWSRSHVAGHVALGARAMSGVCRCLGESGPSCLYDSGPQRDVDIERVALFSGVELQVFLDETAGELDAQWNALAGDERRVTLNDGVSMPAHEMPLARLHELVLHGFDMRTEASRIVLDDEVALLLLGFIVDRIGSLAVDVGYTIIADEGLRASIGDQGGTPQEVRGSAADLIVWLARGEATSALRDAPGVGPRGLIVL